MVVVVSKQEQRKRGITREARGNPKVNEASTRGGNEVAKLNVRKKIDTIEDNNGNGLPLTAKKPTYNDYRSGANIVLTPTQIATGEMQYFGPGGVKPNHSRPPDWNGNIQAPSSSQQSIHG
ncbi:hypothetical protein A2U01_0049742, partial [Trifolium medium]|nr:hypothetical protein [Trifolium medium]